MKYKLLLGKRPNYRYPKFFFDVILSLPPRKEHVSKTKLGAQSVSEFHRLLWHEWNIPQHHGRIQQQKDAQVQNTQFHFI